MRTSRARLGQSAEIAAAAELGRLGYKIITSNYRCRQGEIDLIAQDGNTLVFIEVRCRRSDRFGSPAESITAAKRQKLFVTAQHYLNEQEVEDVPCRFDVVEVTAADGKLSVVDVIRDAFCE